MVDQDGGETCVAIVPVLLGRGERLFEHAGDGSDGSSAPSS
jgi:hypothetical protein